MDNNRQIISTPELEDEKTEEVYQELKDLICSLDNLPSSERRKLLSERQTLSEEVADAIGPDFVTVKVKVYSMIMALAEYEVSKRILSTVFDEAEKGTELTTSDPKD